jgi:hypothetical protein
VAAQLTAPKEGLSSIKYVIIIIIVVVIVVVVVIVSLRVPTRIVNDS